MTHAIVNSRFYHECISSSDIYKGFLIYVTIESVNAKFNTNIDHASFVILQNKHFQLPDNRSTFCKFIDSYVDSNVRPVEEGASHVQLEQATSGSETKENAQMADANANVRISLDLKNDLVEMSIKLAEGVIFSDVTLLLNQDHVVVKHKDQVINDFFLSVPMSADQASASFKSNILRIKCPVTL